MQEAEKMVAPRGHMSLKRLFDTDLCPCGKGKTFGECCRGALKAGLTVENTLHLLFEETDAASKFYAFMSQKMTGEVTPESIIESINKRLWSPPVQRALDRLTWYAVRPDGTSSVFSMVPEPVQLQMPAEKKLLASDGTPIKPE